MIQEENLPSSESSPLRIEGSFDAQMIELPAIIKKQNCKIQTPVQFSLMLRELLADDVFPAKNGFWKMDLCT